MMANEGINVCCPYFTVMVHPQEGSFGLSIGCAALANPWEGPWIANSIAKNYCIGEKETFGCCPYFPGKEVEEIASDHFNTCCPFLRVAWCDNTIDHLHLTCSALKELGENPLITNDIVKDHCIGDKVTCVCCPHFPKEALEDKVEEALEEFIHQTGGILPIRCDLCNGGPCHDFVPFVDENGKQSDPDKGVEVCHNCLMVVDAIINPNFGELAARYKKLRDEAGY